MTQYIMLGHISRVYIIDVHAFFFIFRINLELYAPNHINNHENS